MARQTTLVGVYPGIPNAVHLQFPALLVSREWRSCWCRWFKHGDVQSGNLGASLQYSFRTRTLSSRTEMPSTSAPTVKIRSFERGAVLRSQPLQRRHHAGTCRQRAKLSHRAIRIPKRCGFLSLSC